ncbi:ATP-binding protein [Burkholderia gladioli]|uniref:ATPase associated with various cellular activities family protein n=1 Tax=Burkholderia gladioli TaxID=28095 RepID=A0AAW3F8B4_BURGA|nr:ATP-binding protein [Burkholderia gladioli]AJX00207.1 ATPase associated with various cellular activities family protein [Burkholderia gladioli]ASD78001.1 AAA family ATPase [Burkholderia gladioli pv. gladioli]AWY53089.1 AAA family ATPase [Burkholderia gladioli pv. gladioli]KGC16572.1 ATPase associated with various cellular activities family protein [Burkholderia gladioli]MBU9178233.1 ATP-binding protein [Burkholderia gladioli]
MDKLEQFLDRAEALLGRFEALLPPAPADVDWNAATAFRWRKRQGRGYLQAVPAISQIALDDLHNIDRQKGLIEQNTRQFVTRRPANNVLLTGARGTGKSSLIKACLNAFAADGLRLIEVDKDDLHDLGDIVDLISARPERFIVFCDDLSFEDGESGYKALKVALDGSISAQSDNVLIYATSNRRHLLPEYMSDNESYKHLPDGEIHPGEVVEEKISLSERFGLWVSFYPFKQDDYLAIVGHWLRHFGCDEAQVEAARGDALVWALERGSRSGRVAWQFARDRSGRQESI